MKVSVPGVIRIIAGLATLPVFYILSTWTERTASAQTSGPQLLQVYTRSAFYGIIVVGVLFAIYVATRWID